jgi:predicted ATPase
VLDAVAELVAKSLLVQEEVDGQPRFRFLQTIRDYARERLAEDGEPGERQ